LRDERGVNQVAQRSRMVRDAKRDGWRDPPASIDAAPIMRSKWTTGIKTSTGGLHPVGRERKRAQSRWIILGIDEARAQLWQPGSAPRCNVAREMHAERTQTRRKLTAA
jgi:hypothetical protein